MIFTAGRVILGEPNSVYYVVIKETYALLSFDSWICSYAIEI